MRIEDLAVLLKFSIWCSRRRGRVWDGGQRMLMVLNEKRRVVSAKVRKCEVNLRTGLVLPLTKAVA